MSSGNDAAVALADHVAGSQARFVAMMNERARDWALPCTHYVDPYRLAVRNRSCAEDLAQLAEHALAQPRIAQIARLRSTKVRIGKTAGDGSRRPTRCCVPATRGRSASTGFTDHAGRCLVAAVKRDGDVRVVVMLHAEDPARAVKTTLAKLTPTDPAGTAVPRSAQNPRGEDVCHPLDREAFPYPCPAVRRSHMAYTLPDLPYAYDALEPTIDKATMEFHHDKHHQTYVDKVNGALEGTEWADKPIEEVVKNLSDIPEDKRGPVRNNGGGHYNHTMFWENDGARRRRRSQRRPRRGHRLAPSARSTSSRRSSRQRARASSARAGRGSSSTAASSRSRARRTRTTRSRTARRRCSATTSGSTPTT